MLRCSPVALVALLLFLILVVWAISVMRRGLSCGMETPSCATTLVTPPCAAAAPAVTIEPVCSAPIPAVVQQQPLCSLPPVAAPVAASPLTVMSLDMNGRMVDRAREMQLRYG